MKCPYCGIELSDPIAEIHIESKWCIKEKNEKNKSSEKMNKEELLAKATESGLVIENESQITKAQLVEMINNAN